MDGASQLSTGPNVIALLLLTIINSYSEKCEYFCKENMRNILSQLINRNKEGVIFSVKVIPKAAKNKIGKIVADSEGKLSLKIYVTAVPERGKANDAVIKLVSDYLKIKKSQIVIKHGHTDPYKILQIAGDPDELFKHIETVW